MKTKVFIYLIVFCLLLGLIAAKNRPVCIFMIGDSTMSVKSEKAFPENGWGMALSSLIKEDAVISNFAVNGRSSKSFIDEGRWDSVCNKIKKGDYVIIQFGHNDSKPDSARHTNPQTTYKHNLRKFVTDSRNKGANPILCTSVIRRHFGSNGMLTDTHGGYPRAMREVAAEMNVPLIDLQKLTEKEINKLGPVESKKLFMMLNPGEYPNFPEGKSDSTHLRIEGACFVAKLFIHNAKKQHLPVSYYFKK